MTLEADLDHRRDGQRARRHGVGDGRSRDRAQHGRGHDRHLGRPAREAARQRRCQVDEQLSKADLLCHDAEQDEVEHIGRDHAKRSAINPLRGQVQVVDDRVPVGARVDQDAGHRPAPIGIGDEQQRDHRQGPAHRPAHGLHQGDQQQRAHDDVQRHRVADAEGKLVIDPGHVKGADRPGDGQEPVHDRNAQDGKAGGLVAPAVEGREAEKDHEQRHAHVQPAMGRGARDPEACGIEVIHRQQKQDHSCQDRDRAEDRAEPGFGVVFLLDRAQFGVGQLACSFVHSSFLRFGERKRTRTCGPRPSNRIGPLLTEACLLPCRTVRRPGGTGCPPPVSRYPT